VRRVRSWQSGKYVNGLGKRRLSAPSSTRSRQKKKKTGQAGPTENRKEGFYIPASGKKISDGGAIRLRRIVGRHASAC